MHFSKFLDLLACPVSGEALQLSADRTILSSPSGANYPVINDVPELLTPEDKSDFATVIANEGASMVKQYQNPKQRKSPAKNAKAERGWDEVFPPLNLPLELLNDLYYRKGDQTRILSVGGGPTRNNEQEINLNMGAFPNVDVVGSALHLPFLSNSVDGVWCNAVLEHVAGAPVAVTEMVRVTEPGGYIACLVPFMQPLHAYPADYQRYSADGLAFLMRDLEILAKGQCVGPSYAMYELLRSYLNGPGKTCIPRWIRGITRRILIPALRNAAARRLDWTGRPEDELSPSVVFCIGMKR